MYNIPDILVTTHHSLVLIRNGNIHKEWHGPNPGLLFGITWDQTYLYIASRNSPSQHESIILFHKNEGLEPVGQAFLDCVKGVHQIYHNGSNLYIMNTNKKQITSIGDGINNFDWPDANWATHINSIWQPKNSNKFYIIEHNGGNPPSNLCLIINKKNKWKFIKRWKNIGLHCHNIHIDNKNNIFTTLSSMQHKIKQFKLKYNVAQLIKEKQIDALGSNRWYLRGLAKNNEYWVLGLSTHQEIKQKVTTREQRERYRSNTKYGGIVVLDNDWNIIHELELSNRGQIHDLRILGHDECHNNIKF